MEGTFPNQIGGLNSLDEVHVQGTGITGNLDLYFCTGRLSMVTANCLNHSAVICTCCSVCCDEMGQNCEEIDE